MSTAANTLDHHGHDGHDPHLAHHFDTAEQQTASGKLGMWVFLGTEILMFGGLFCAYSVYRHNHPEVFKAGHEYLDVMMGGINTVILITSSLTMAWAVRAAQLGKRMLCAALLAFTLVGGFGFLTIKFFEYSHKYHADLWIGTANQFHPLFDHSKAHSQEGGDPKHGLAAAPATAPAKLLGPGYADPNAGTADEAKVRPNFAAPRGMAPPPVPHYVHPQSLPELKPADRDNLSTFFQIYYMMTGLHGIHVLVGMALIAWILLRTVRGDFSTTYFAPVDLVGLYWHLVDLIWIFLFPLLYLIH